MRGAAAGRVRRVPARQAGRPAGDPRRLLGLGVYERIAREANREAAAAGDRAALLAEQLGAYVDATDEAVAEAGGRVVALAALAERVGALLPEVSVAARAVVAAEDLVAALRAEQARLGALRAPDGLEELDARRRGAGERVRAARVRFTDAEAADDTARALLAEAPVRAPRERARRDHTELVAALAARPAAADALDAAQAAEDKAARQVEEAEEAAHGRCEGPRVGGGGARLGDDGRGAAGW